MDQQLCGIVAIWCCCVGTLAPDVYCHGSYIGWFLKCGLPKGLHVFWCGWPFLLVEKNKPRICIEFCFRNGLKCNTVCKTSYIAFCFFSYTYINKISSISYQSVKKEREEFKMTSALDISGLRGWRAGQLPEVLAQQPE